MHDLANLQIVKTQLYIVRDRTAIYYLNYLGGPEVLQHHTLQGVSEKVFVTIYRS